MTVTVTSAGTGQAGLAVLAYDGESYTGLSAGTDDLGRARFVLPKGSYRFMVEQYGQPFWSGAENHCTLPGCDSAAIATRETLSGMTQQKITYTYDALNRLAAAEYEDGRSFHYTYDAVGNRLSETARLVPNQEPVTTTYTYDDANRLTAVNGVTYTWDANGNLLSDGLTTYAYDDANRLIEANGSFGTSTYRYNRLGDRVQSTENGVTTNYALDLAAGLTQVLDDGQHTYLYGNGRVGYSSDNLYYYLGDALGSVRAVAQGGEDAPVVMTRDYAPYGEVLAGQGTNPTPYGYTGEWTDASGLVYLRARYYSPADGRFLSKDTWQGDYNSPLSLNRWSYVEGSPINLIDPSGHDAIVITDQNNVLGLGHTSALLQKSTDGPWYYFYWGSTEVTLQEVTSDAAMKSITGLNNWLHNNHLYVGANYTDSVYIKGDFSASFSQAENIRESGFSSYNLTSKNCFQVTFTVLNDGKLDNGTSFREILDGSSFLVPSVAHERARAALYNNAYTIEEFGTQLRAFISLRRTLLGLSTTSPCRSGYGTAYLIWITEIERAEELLGDLAQDYQP